MTSQVSLFHFSKGNSGNLLSVVAVAAILFTFAGCSTVPSTDYSSVGLVNVSGKVMLDGTPLEAAVVTFEDAQTGQFSYGQTDSNGYYSLQLDSEMEGVMPGQKIVRISTSKKILGLNVTEDDSSGEEVDGEMEADGKGKGAVGLSTEIVPDKYNKKSELTADVSSSSSTFDFDLKS